MSKIHAFEITSLDTTQTIEEEINEKTNGKKVTGISSFYHNSTSTGWLFVVVDEQDMKLDVMTTEAKLIVVALNMARDSVAEMVSTKEAKPDHVVTLENLIEKLESQILRAKEQGEK